MSTIKYSDIPNYTVRVLPPDVKNIGKTKSTYQDINLKLSSMSNTGEEILQEFKFRTPKVHLRGIRKFQAEEGKVSYSVGFKVDNSSPETVEFKNIIDKVYSDIAKDVFKHKDQIRDFKNFTPENIENFIAPLHKFTKDEVGNSVVGKPPGYYFKLKFYNNENGSVNKTKFFDAGSKKEISWETLEKVGFEAILVIHLKKIFKSAGKMATLQWFVDSALVTKIIANDGLDQFGDDLDEISRSVGNSVSSSIAALNGETVSQPAVSTEDLLDSVPNMDAMVIES